MFIDKFWYTYHPLRWLLYPFAAIYRFITIMRCYFLQNFCQKKFPVPIIVVGNITVGGVGKTPLVCALAQRFLSKGLRVGIVSRGYGACIKNFPYVVTVNDKASRVGDEPLLLAKRTGCPVVIDPERTRAVQHLLDNYKSQVIISDDGLQHYKMGRAIEIVVIDGSRGFGNGLCLPAGPLREGVKRLRQADYIVVNGPSKNFDANETGSHFPPIYNMVLQPGEFIQLGSGCKASVKELGDSIAAVAGIGHPQRFFSMLSDLGLDFSRYPFRDHHRYKAEEFLFQEKIVVMTEKDAVKCLPFATDALYFLPVEAKMSEEFWRALLSHQHLQGYI